VQRPLEWDALAAVHMSVMASGLMRRNLKIRGMNITPGNRPFMDAEISCVGGRHSVPILFDVAVPPRHWFPWLGSFRVSSASRRERVNIRKGSESLHNIICAVHQYGVQTRMPYKSSTLTDLESNQIPGHHIKRPKDGSRQTSDGQWAFRSLCSRGNERKVWLFSLAE
jgi:hypothetical protein